MALAGRFSPMLEAYKNTLNREKTTLNRGRIQPTQTTKNTPQITLNRGRFGRQSFTPAPSTPQSLSAPAPSIPQGLSVSTPSTSQGLSSPASYTPKPLFGKDSFSGLDLPVDKAYTKQEYDDIVANAMAVGKTRNNAAAGYEFYHDPY